MKILTTLLLLIFSFAFFSCSSEKAKLDMASSDYYDVPNLGTNNNYKKVKKIALNSSKMDSTISTSFVGNLWVNDNSLYFSDSHFNYVFHLDANGNLINTFLGRGEGPNEITDLDDIVANDNGSYTVLNSSSASIYNFDKHWSRINKVQIDFAMKRSYQDVMDNPEPSLPESYELETGYDDIMMNWDDKYVAMSVNASHPTFNGYFKSNLFYNHSRVLALIDKKTGVIEAFLGRRPPIYLEKQNIPSFNHFKFETDTKNAYLSFMPDSNIYVIDKITKLAIGKFGTPGKNMKTNYRLTDNFEQAQDNEVEDFTVYGYYSNIKLIPDEDLIFKTYTRGEGAINDGLQIYKSYNLIGDVNVPKGFKIIGKIDDDYIGTISKENSDEEVLIYKIKFNYED